MVPTRLSANLLHLGFLEHRRWEQLANGLVGWQDFHLHLLDWLLHLDFHLRLRTVPIRQSGKPLHLDFPEHRSWVKLDQYFLSATRRAETQDFHHRPLGWFLRLDFPLRLTTAPTRQSGKLLRLDFLERLPREQLD